MSMIDLDIEETTVVEFRDPLNARDYAKSLNLLCALYDWAQHLNRGHARVCDCNLCMTLKATDNFLNHREG